MSARGKFDDVLVGVDFSPASLAAIRHACVLAGESGRVRLLHVVDSSGVPRHTYLGQDFVARLVDGLIADAEQTIGELARDLASNGTHVTTSVRVGRPEDVIVQEGASADLVIVGAHARGLLERFTLGSVAEEVARRSETPTLVVRETAEGAGVERVLVAIDVREPESEPIAEAAALADRLAVRLEAISVVEPAGGEDAARVLPTILTQSIGRKADIHVAEGTPWREIVRAARPTDILVCGTHGRGAIGRLAFGSVAQQIARKAPCPVLLVRPAPSIVRLTLPA